MCEGDVDYNFNTEEWDGYKWERTNEGFDTVVVNKKDIMEFVEQNDVYEIKRKSTGV